MEHKGVVGDGFQIVAFPAAMERAKFLLIWVKIDLENKNKTYQP